ncbi:Six-hairpin glycosidase [Aureobasidium sp. EXF-10727]|nr:Six-hairpin glycosidase [Aureobasidium sp. EXF-10727]
MLYSSLFLMALQSGLTIKGAKATPAPVHEKRALDTTAIAKKYFGNDAPWYQDRIAYFECSDSQITDVFYYRWKIFRAHQRDLGAKGYISTEFLDDVGWQLEPYASLNDATGFHVAEGRWNRDRRFKDDYLSYMLAGGDDRHFTDYIQDSVWGSYLVDNDVPSATKYLDQMKSLYNSWSDHFDSSKGLYWIEPLLDATEYTISSIDASGGKDGFTGGDAFRPSINSYMYANARALAKLADLAGQSSVADDYNSRAAAIKSNVQKSLWNSTLTHFIDRYKVSNDYVKYWDPIRGRELVGVVPWTFDLPDNSSEYASSWKHLLDSNELGGAKGLRTVEPSYQYYMKQYRYDAATGRRECQWNGPAWPFQTTQALLGMSNLLDHYQQNAVTNSDYIRLLRQYTQLHYNGATLNLQEDYDPDQGGAIVGLPRSPHYFHSGYIDLIMTGLVGIRPRADDFLEINPLITSDIKYFRAEEVPYHGTNIVVQWDADGSRYGQGAGLRVERDGAVIATSPTLKRLVIPFQKKAIIAIDRPIAKSIQLQSSTNYPKGTASSGTDVENVHDAIDGRVWFFPELANGWNSDANSAANQWYTITFESATQISRAELAFFDNGNDFKAPTAYSIQVLSNGNWIDIGEQKKSAVVANGITNVQFSSTSVTQVRLSMTQASGARTRLVEVKYF